MASQLTIMSRTRVSMMPRILAFFAHPPTLAPLAQVAQVVSSPRPAYTQEKREGQSRRHDAAPQEVVLRSRFDSVIQTETDAVDVSPRFIPPFSSLHTDICPVFHPLPPFLPLVHFQFTDIRMNRIRRT